LCNVQGRYFYASGLTAKLGMTFGTKMKHPKDQEFTCFGLKEQDIGGQIFDWLRNQFGEVSQSIILVVWSAFNSACWAQHNHLC
jgi:hypothetical protein